MYPIPVITSARGHAANAFEELRHRAILSGLWATLNGTERRLANFFDDEAGSETASRTFCGLKDIPVDRIVGSLDRHTDFDGRFRPLGKHLRDRWIHALVSLSIDAWAPIIVHQVEDRFYVEDGHHRVSVANHVGMAFIQAAVWKHAPAPILMNISQPAPQLQMAECDVEACSE